jgi:hypothetical protein
MEFEAIWHKVGGIKPIVGSAFLPLSAAEVEMIESALGHALPDDYRTFLMSYGASAFRRRVRFTPVRRLPSSISYSGSDYIDALYGKEPPGRDAYSLVQRIQFYGGRMPDTLIPIGDNGCGNQICLAIAGDFAGQVFYWDRNSEIDDEEYFEQYGYPPSPEVRFANLYPIAGSFADFLQGLVADPDD